ncbi:zinc finger MYM-type protein 4 isoform X1 [Oryzias melastigma]|uniref:Zinc finger MYM-type protein 4-like n=1 Tax=Oryzias melastigma TaxID=30732 RepID=A0A3B3DSY7_ORYME|nr:zinc finger MYM-type protein 4 isoform X1 [Oryzias melastigma]XP_036070211.1 zinc finger MYM-type protein 4 isoform X1 [Oryzias melastigma]
MACSAPNCSNRHSNSGLISFFRFPLGDAVRLDKWMRNMGRDDWIPKRNSRLCSVHFNVQDLIVDYKGRMTLKDTAVPTIFLKSPDTSCKRGRRRGRSDYRRLVNEKQKEMEETDEESVLEPEVLVEDEDTETLSGSFSSRLFELEENSVENQNNQETNHNCSAAEALIPAESESEDRVVTVDVASMETETEELQMQEKLELQEKSVGNQVLPAGQSSREERNTDTADCKDDDRPTNDNPDEEGEGSFSNKSSFGHKQVISTADLDEMMDMGIVDQIDQEAQMKEEEQKNMDVEGSQSPSNSSKEDQPSAEEETDVKPTASDLMQSSEARAGGDESSPQKILNGMKEVTLPENLSAPSQTPESSSPPPLAKVKDEPVDEEYDQALLSSVSVKDEPVKEDLKIGSVFSVTSGGELQSSSLQHMFCSHCGKHLVKGQTAFQRKGSPALFCSTLCLETFMPNGKGASKVCNTCQKVIKRPQDVIMSPDGKGTMQSFCSQSCLSTFKTRKSSGTSQTPQNQFLCSICTQFGTTKHEVVLKGVVHKMCSDACFSHFRILNSLSMSGCASCGSCSHNKPLMLKMDSGCKTLCNTECLAKFKEKTKISQPCTMCRTPRLLGQMIENKNVDDSVNLFCSTSCVMAFKVQSVSSSGAQINCDSCGKTAVPSYHLAMSDTSIRNFCSLPCVMAFQEKFKKSQGKVDFFPKLPNESSQAKVAASPQPPPQTAKNTLELKCFQCDQIIMFKPEYFQIKDKIVFLCSSNCTNEYKKANFVMSLCEYCKIEKVAKEVKRINNKICHFCSDGCKLLFRHETSKNWGKHCHSCTYCNCVSKKLVTAQYGGSVEEFCSEECRKKYTMLFCHMAKCDTCGRKGKLKESLPLLREVKHFCGLGCLLMFCTKKVATQGKIAVGKVEDSPVIANVMSLAGTPKTKTDTSDRSAEQSTAAKKSSGHISIATETMKSHPPLPPPGIKILKNKALLCKPLVQNKGVSCKTQTVDAQAQTDEVPPKIMVLPVPVPVYLPVPMNMYSQYTPKPVGLPLPVPVPMFLPVTMDNAEGIIETIQEIKDKIPSDPFEAELILMAEMVAEQSDKSNKADTQKEKQPQKEAEKQEVLPSDDHISNCSDLDTDDLASLLNNWDEASSDAGTRPASLSGALEKIGVLVDSSAGEQSEPLPEAPPPGPPPMDIEAEFTVETLDIMIRERQKIDKPKSPPPAASRRQAHRKSREKRGRKSQPSSKAAEPASDKSLSKKSKEMLKLKSQYGVDAWKRWIQWRQKQPGLKKPRFGSRPLELKEDLLRCTTAELSYGLCCFVTEVKRPNGEPYSPDSLFYLCLGIQKYLFENSRVENIFMDRFYSKFSAEFTNMLRGFQPAITPSGYVHSRVEEEFLWDCKQLGAYSPIVLLNTLLYFCCKYFGFTTVEQHRQLSFAHVMRCTKTNQDNTKTTFLRFYPPIPVNEADTESNAVPAKRKKEEENKEDILEMVENTENPLRCPVRLYEFYLSKCSELVRQRTNMFYLHPERCCVPNSPLWFSSTPLDNDTMDAMLTRVLTVRELHPKSKRGRRAAKEDPPFVPEDEEEDSD